ncbi:MAG: YgjV family protein [Clostridia bacterium]|nr:YgjV family protein [Clostridia bacterium]
MNTWEIIAQVFGILALAANVLSFHFRQYRQIVIVQILSSVFFTVHFILLYVSGRTDALTAGVLNGLSLFRNGLLLFTEKKRTPTGTALIAGFFSAAVIAIGILTWNSWLSVLFIISMVLVTVSMSVRKPNMLRLLMMIAAPFAFVYDILIGSIGGSINEAVSFVSVLIAFIRNRNR